MQISDLVNQYTSAGGTAEGMTGTKGVNKLVSSLREMAAGNIFEGTVNSMKNGKVVLGLSNGRTVTARLDGKISLTVGQSMFFQVKSNDGLQIAIRPYTVGGNTANPTLMSALQAAGLPVDGKNLSMVNSMMQEQMPIDVESLHQMARVVASNENINVQTVVAMQKLGIPVTEEFAAQFENYMDDRQAIGKAMEGFMEELPQTLSNEVFSAGELRQMGSQILAIITEGLSEEAQAVIEEAAQEGTAGGQDGTQVQEGVGLPQDAQGMPSGAGMPGAQNAEMAPGVDAGHGEDTAQNVDVTSGLDAEQSTGAAQNADTASGADAGQSTGTAQDTAAAQNADTAQDTAAAQGSTASQNANTAQNTDTAQGSTAAQNADTSQNADTAQGSTAAQNANTAQDAAAAQNANTAQGPASHSLQALLSPKQLQELSGLLKGFPGLADNAKLFPEGQLKAGTSSVEVLRAVQEAMGKDPLIGKSAITKLFSSEGMANLMRDAMEQQWLLRPQELGRGDKISNLYEKLESQISRMENVVKAAGMENTALAQAAADIRGNVDFMNQINQAYTYVQIPLKMNGQNASGQLYVYTNKKNLSKEGDKELTAFLHLDLDNLGSTDVSVKMLGRKVDTNFYLQDDASFNLVQANLPMLEERLQKKGYSCKLTVTNENKHVNFVEDFLKKDQPSAGQLHRYSFDMRA